MSFYKRGTPFNPSPYGKSTALGSSVGDRIGASIASSYAYPPSPSTAVQPAVAMVAYPGGRPGGVLVATNIPSPVTPVTSPVNDMTTDSITSLVSAPVVPIVAPVLDTTTMAPVDGPAVIGSGILLPYVLAAGAAWLLLKR